MSDEHPHKCPTCHRAFEDAGYCPYDGKPLVDTRVADKPTLQTPDAPSHKIRAESAPDTDSIIETIRRDEPSEYDQLVGQTLGGRYFVLRKIGEGGMGVVFAAKHAVIERPLAIKVLKREVMRDLVTIARFRQEAKAASRIGHPNIVDVIDFDTTDTGMTFSVMEFVDGPTLASAIKEAAPFAAERALRIASQLARALAAAHDKGIVHRDLKPENVFLIDRDERPDFVKIVDFGIARVTPLDGGSEPRLTRAGSVFGTPEYMAPEQASGKGDLDRRVDIYALGIILYEMIVGRVPIKGRTLVQTIAMQMLEPIVPPTKARPDLSIAGPVEAVIMKALAKNRDERYQTMTELMHALDDAARRLHADATLALQPLPPGADPATETAQPPVELRSHDGPRRKKPETRPLHEPEFMSAPSAPLSFGGVFEADAPPPIDESRRRWLVPLVVAILVVIGGVAAVMIALRADRDDERAASTARDAAIVATPRADAATIVADVPADAGTTPREPPRDAGPRIGRVVRDAGVARRKPRNGDSVGITVYVKPGEAKLFHGDEYIGEYGVTVERPYGTILTLECRTLGYKGKVTLVFDGSHDNLMCNAARDKKCVKDIKNPFDHCDDDETAPGEGPALHPAP